MLENNQNTMWQISDHYRDMYIKYDLSNWPRYFDPLRLVYVPIDRQFDAI